jgi:hypothetical protein
LIYFCVIAKNTFKPEVKLEVRLKGEDTEGKKCLFRRRFKRRGVADAESICEDYNIRAFFLKASRSTRKAGKQSCQESQIVVLI